MRCVAVVFATRRVDEAHELSVVGMKRVVVALVLSQLLTLGLASSRVQGEESSGGGARYELVYAGEFIDQDAAPVAGVFPLLFKIYPEEKGKKAMWSESHFVSVVDGNYIIILGRQESLPKRAADETVYLGVELNGTELVRQPIRAKVVSDQVRVAGPSLLSANVEYAERAGDAATLGGFGPNDFAPASLVDQFNQHARNKDLHGGGGGGGGGGAVLSGTPHKSDFAGGSGGKIFTLLCPAGFVMTGIEGRSGAVLDSIRVVCTKLE